MHFPREKRSPRAITADLNILMPLIFVMCGPSHHRFLSAGSRRRFKASKRTARRFASTRSVALRSFQGSHLFIYFIYLLPPAQTSENVLLRKIFSKYMSYQARKNRKKVLARPKNSSPSEQIFAFVSFPSTRET